MDMSSINWLAVVVAAVLSLAVGFVWYSKPVFLMPWLRGIEKDESFAQESNPITFVFAFISALIEAVFVTFLLTAMGSTTLVSGLTAGFMIWLGFVFTTQWVNNLFAKQSFSLTLITSGYHLVMLLIMGALLAVWR
jgi:hypothetical protein